jgi:hypothetical protein
VQDRLRRQVAARLLGPGVAVAILLGGVAALAPSPAAAQTAPRQASLSTEVPAGQFRGLRLRNVPKSARIAIAAKATVRIALSLLNAEDAAKYPAPGEPLFTAPVESALSFSVVIPASGDYVLMLDNSKGDAPSKVNLLMRAARGDVGTLPPPESIEPAVPRTPDAERPRLRTAPVPMHEM